MAIDKEFLGSLFKGIEGADEKIATVIAEYEREKLPILKNRDDIKAEKTAIEKKHAELSAAFAELESAKKELNEKLESGLPDKEKKIFQEEIENLKGKLKGFAEESNRSKTEFEATIKKLSDEKTHYIISEEFSKLINANTAIKPTMRIGLPKRFFSDYPLSGFELYNNDGITSYVNKDGKKMSDLLNNFLGTDEGKEYLLNLGNGGGASGSQRPATTTGGMKRKDFDALSYEQQDAYMKNKGVVHD